MVRVYRYFFLSLVDSTLRTYLLTFVAINFDASEVMRETVNHRELPIMEERICVVD